MGTSKRPLVNPKQNELRAQREVQSSNDTANMVLGGKQYAWMVGAGGGGTAVTAGGVVPDHRRVTSNHNASAAALQAHSPGRGIIHPFELRHDSPSTSTSPYVANMPPPTTIPHMTNAHANVNANSFPPTTPVLPSPSPSEESVMEGADNTLYNVLAQTQHLRKRPVPLSNSIDVYPLKRTRVEDTNRQVSPSPLLHNAVLMNVDPSRQSNNPGYGQRSVQTGSPLNGQSVISDGSGQPIAPGQAAFRQSNMGRGPTASPLQRQGAISTGQSPNTSSHPSPTMGQLQNANVQVSSIPRRQSSFPDMATSTVPRRQSSNNTPVPGMPSLGTFANTNIHTGQQQQQQQMTSSVPINWLGLTENSDPSAYSHQAQLDQSQQYRRAQMAQEKARIEQIQMRSLQQQQQAINAAAPNKPYHSSMCLPVYAEWFTMHPEELDALAGGRMSVLKSAIDTNDAAYLFMHQIFCLHSVNANAVPQQLRSLPTFPHAMAALESTLASNLKMGQELLTWMSEFPTNLTDVALNYTQVYFHGIEHTKNLCDKLGRHWENYAQECEARGWPPVASELYNFHGVQSSQFMEILFTAALRKAWKNPKESHPSFAEALNVFIQNRSWFMDRISKSGIGIPEAERRQIDDPCVQHYKQLRELLVRHPGLQPGELVQAQHDQVDIQQEQQALHLQAQERQRQRIQQMQPQQDHDQFHHHQMVLPSNVQPSQNHSLTIDTRNTQQPRILPTNSPIQNTPTSYMNSAGPVRTVSGPATLPMPTPAQAGSSSHVQHRPGQYQGRWAPSAQHLVHSNAQPPAPPPAPVQVQKLPQQPDLNHPIIPVNTAAPPLPAAPTWKVSALHQAHLRSPILSAQSDLVDPKPQSLLYQEVVGFALNPQHLDSGSLVQKRVFWVSAEQKALIPPTEPSSYGAPPLRIISETSIQYRLRCSKGPRQEGDSSIQEQSWVVADTSFPTYMYIQFNGHILEVRRKLHHGKDLPIDLTHFIVEGENKLELFLNTDIGKGEHANYATAIELVGVKTHEQISAACQDRLIPAEESLAEIKKYLAPANNPNTDDDDIVIVSENVTINLYDSISLSQTCPTAVRSKHCLHRQNFDLSSFLESRPHRKLTYPSMVDVWRCPICRCDARPQNLFVDGFIVDVQNFLKEKGDEETRAIVVDADGNWRGKVETRASDGHGGSGRNSSTSRAGSLSKGPPASAVVVNGKTTDLPVARSAAVNYMEGAQKLAELLEQSSTRAANVRRDAVVIDVGDSD
ncbi:hypothetical protein EJ08DRAFT_697668 [Tothia fuscella]|uniref:SP-RING-type domain-containing protein n=1 Tax=Tothia fuscella TaxID=1048955 RepID=A0A9P4NR40_9PEZI|nr:hypothetical protein EJ08DRAFT_697668 [Tothia fuscella]